MREGRGEKTTCLRGEFLAATPVFKVVSPLEDVQSDERSVREGMRL